MTVSKRRRTRAERLARGAWIAVACTPLGWAVGITLALLRGEGEANGIGPVTLGILRVLLFAAAPATAVILAVQAARADHRSGRIAVMVYGLLLLATLVLTLLVGFLGLVLAAVVAVLVAALARPPRQAVAAQARRCAARGRIACGSSAARTIWTEAVSPPGLVPSSRGAQCSFW